MPQKRYSYADTFAVGKEVSNTILENLRENQILSNLFDTVTLGSGNKDVEVTVLAETETTQVDLRENYLATAAAATNQNSKRFFETKILATPSVTRVSGVEDFFRDDSNLRTQTINNLMRYFIPQMLRDIFCSMINTADVNDKVYGGDTSAIQNAAWAAGAGTMSYADFTRAKQLLGEQFLDGEDYKMAVNFEQDRVLKTDSNLLGFYQNNSSGSGRDVMESTGVIKNIGGFDVLATSQMPWLFRTTGSPAVLTLPTGAAAKYQATAPTASGRTAGRIALAWNKSAVGFGLPKGEKPEVIIEENNATNYGDLLITAKIPYRFGRLRSNGVVLLWDDGV